ncbi:hypothetical protein [Maritimibacter dapengensis]|uniref:hypothetical protein n=1 Tax=Maritimibacter dapengensis TaxID=2836868 RepID=UPI002105D32A|nr:hypothetical protein [Maritimibacter dapengensis]
MKFKSLLLVAAAATSLTACAKSGRNIEAAEVSPVMYQGLSCGQISAEAQRVANRASEVSGVQDQEAARDAVATGVAVVLFWPAAFFIGGNDETASQLSQLKGQLNALEAASNAKNCGITFKTVETSPNAAPKS